MALSLRPAFAFAPSFLLLGTLWAWSPAPVFGPGSAQELSGLRNAGTPSGKRAELQTLGLPREPVRPGARLEFQVRVESGAPLASLKLRNPQPGMVFEPVLRREPPFDRDVRWQIPEGAGERVDLIFELERIQPTGPTSGVSAPPQTLVVPIRIARDAGPMVRVGDLTGDGFPDVVAVARQADPHGVVNGGIGYVWLGRTTPFGEPDATLELQFPMAGDQLGDGAKPALQLFDLNGDGLLDIVLAAERADVNGVLNAGAVYAFLGYPGFGGTHYPDVTYRRPNPQVNDRFGSLAVQFGDLTGDGVPELLCGSSFADVGGTVDAGGIWVWSLGANVGLDQEPAPLRELSRPNPIAGDRLGHGSGEAVQVIDLNGDTISDVVISAQLADVQSYANLGEVLVWQGGAQFAQGTTPDAVLNTEHAVQPMAGDRLGLASGQGVQFADLTGDGYLDVVVGASQADGNGVVNSGAVYVFRGAASLANMGTWPELELSVSNANVGDALGEGTGQTIQFADLSGDGVLDLFVHAEGAGGGDGRIYVWEDLDGLSGQFSPSAELVGYGTGERLGHLSGQGVFAVEIDGDGILDIVAGTALTEDSGSPQMGALYLWRGSEGFSAGLRFPSESFFQSFNGIDVGFRMGDLTGPGLQFFDVTGDLRLDMVTGSTNANETGTLKEGAVYIWEGGPGLSSSAPNALFVPGATAGDQLCRGAGQGIRVHDWNGDSVLDLFVSAELADDQSIVDAGAFYIWEGGPTLPFSTPVQTLRTQNPQPGDRLGAVSGASLLFADLDGDLLDDLVIGAQYADYGPMNTGAYYFYYGGWSPPGERYADSVLVTPVPRFGDQLGGGSFGMQAFDMTGDGFLDLLIGAAFADEASVVNSGALYLWEGGAQSWWNPETTAGTVLAPSQASVGDLLGG